MNNNSDSELEKFKTEINLAAYLEHLGFIYDPKKSTHNIPVFKGNNDYEVFIVSKKIDNGHHVFMNPYNESDCGSIIDFVLNRNKNMNLGQVRKHLRSYLGEFNQANLKDYHKYKSNKLDIQSIRKMFAKATILKHREFMYSRGISDQVLDSDFLKNRIGNQSYTHSNGQTFHNTVFPIYNLNGLAGLERRNDGYKAAAGDSDKAQGMWFSYFNKEDPSVHQKFFISESPIDCISKAQLIEIEKNDLSMLFFSSNGSLNKGQFEFVQYYINKCEPKEVVLGNDNDPAGARFNLNYLGNLKDVNPTFQQENTSFFLKPVTGDSSKVHLDFELKGLSDQHLKLKDQVLQDLNKIQSIKDHIIVYPLENGKGFRVTFDNKKEEIEQVTKLVQKHRKLKVAKVEKPISKDFNQDLMNQQEKILGLQQKKKVNQSMSL